MAAAAGDGIRQPDLAPAQGSAVDAVVRQIRKFIAEEKLTVGDNLPTERELCVQFGASRNTVREAMRILKAYGMVDVRPKIGATITDNRMERVFDLFSFNTIEISRKAFSDIQGFRSMVEVDSVERIFDNARPSDIAELRRLNDQICVSETIPAASDADFLFHVKLVSILKNDAVVEIYKMMKPVIIRIMELRKAEAGVWRTNHQQHADVVDALEARNRINYQYSLQIHLEMGLRRFDETWEDQGASE